MDDRLIQFPAMAWENPVPGVRQKVFERDGQRLRVVEFTEDFVEAGWCEKGHIGYVVEGRMMIQFEERRIEFKAGDGLFISAGDRHRAKVAKGEKALLVLVEKNYEK